MQSSADLDPSSADSSSASKHSCFQRTALYANSASLASEQESPEKSWGNRSLIAGAKNLDHHLQLQIPAMLHGFLSAETHTQPEANLREMLGQPGSLGP